MTSKDASIAKAMLADAVKRADDLQDELDSIRLDVQLTTNMMKALLKIIKRRQTIFGKEVYEVTVFPGSKAYEDIEYLNEIYGGEEDDS